MHKVKLTIAFCHPVFRSTFGGCQKRGYSLKLSQRAPFFFHSLYLIIHKYFYFSFKVFLISVPSFLCYSSSRNIAIPSRIKCSDSLYSSESRRGLHSQYLVSSTKQFPVYLSRCGSPPLLGDKPLQSKHSGLCFLCHLLQCLL